MFADSLLETSWAQRSRRGWTTVTSFGIEAVIVGVLITIPLLRTVGIPLARTVSTPIILGRHDPAPAHIPAHAQSSTVQIVPYTGQIMAPGRVPGRVYRGPDTSSTGPIGPSIGSEIGLPFDPSGIHLPIAGTHPVMPIIAASAVKPPFKTSTMLQGSLIRRVEPVYPGIARAARIQGPVVLEAIISKEGTIENLRLISGRPMLVQAALAAVSQWRYKPYILNGEAIEVETQITVNFVLAEN